jgi:DNA replication protein DnaC
VSASVLFTKANASYGTEWREQAEEILLTAGPLILDDLGKEKPTALARQLLQSAIEDRIENQVHLLITSNHQANELGAIYGDWLASRLGAMPQWNMPGPDLRLEV